MGRCRALFVALLFGLAGGCTSDRAVTSTTFLRRLSPFQGSNDSDSVHVDVALIQIPFADSARYSKLWTFLDEQAVALEKKGPLEENGFRIGRVGANPPAEILELVSQKRTCPDPRRVQMQPDREGRLLGLGPARAKLAFEAVQGEQSNRAEFEQAQCCLAVTPHLTDDGRTRLQAVPKIKHDNKGRLGWLPLPDRSGWTRLTKPPEEVLSDLGWETVLGQGEYLVIGAREDRPETLGYETFIRADEPLPVKRLLILRVWRPVMGKPFGEDQNGYLMQAPPLAAQASWTARGARQ